MKKFFKALTTHTLIAATLAAAIYYLERKGILSIEYSGGSPFKLKEVDFAATGKNIFRSSDKTQNEKLNEQIERSGEKLNTAFDFEFADAAE